MAIKSNTELLEDIADAKAVMTTGSMNEADPEEEAEEAPAEDSVDCRRVEEFEEVAEDTEEEIAEETAEEEEKELKVPEKSIRL